jgi:hypothetical protein
MPHWLHWEVQAEALDVEASGRFHWRHDEGLQQLNALAGPS